MGKTIYRLAIFLLAAITIGVAPFVYISWKGMREENDERLLSERKLAYQVQSLEDELAYKREYYERLIGDDKFAERVIRDKLGFADPRDIVFRFDDSKPTTIDDGVLPPQYAPTLPQRAPRKSTGAANVVETKPRSVLDRLLKGSSEQPSRRAEVEPAFTIDMSAENTEQGDKNGEPQDFAENSAADDDASADGAPAQQASAEIIYEAAAKADGGSAHSGGTNVIRFRNR